MPEKPRYRVQIKIEDRQGIGERFRDGDLLAEVEAHANTIAGATAALRRAAEAIGEDLTARAFAPTEKVRDQGAADG